MLFRSGKYRENIKKRAKTNNPINNAIDYMNEHKNKHLTLEDISNHVGLSKSYFSGIFKKHTGFSPIDYMIQIKMKEACQMLDFTNMKINQICHLIGIEDPYYFSKLFSKTIGISPTDYRIKKKG